MKCSSCVCAAESTPKTCITSPPILYHFLLASSSTCPITPQTSSSSQSSNTSNHTSQEARDREAASTGRDVGGLGRGGRPGAGRRGLGRGRGRRGHGGHGSNRRLRWGSRWGRRRGRRALVSHGGRGRGRVVRALGGRRRRAWRGRAPGWLGHGLWMVVSSVSMCFFCEYINARDCCLDMYTSVCMCV